MSSELGIVTPFDYGTLDPQRQDALRKTSADLREDFQRFSEDICRIGARLANAQLLLADHRDGVFQAWLRDEFGLSKSTAYRFISVYQRLGSRPNLGRLQVAASALYLLAENATPEPVVETVLERAESGEAITLRDTRETRDAYWLSGACRIRGAWAGSWLLTEAAYAAPDLATQPWVKRYLALKKRHAPDGLLFAAVGDIGLMTLREDAQAAAEQFGLPALNTEIGAAVLLEKKAFERVVVEPAAVIIYPEEDPAAAQFYFHHTRRLAEPVRTPARGAALPPGTALELRVGDRVRTRLGRETTVTAVNGRFIHVTGDTRHHYPETLTRLEPDEDATAEREPPAPSKPGTGAAMKQALHEQGLSSAYRVVQHKKGGEYTAAFDSHVTHTQQTAAAAARGYAEQLALAGYRVVQAGVDIDLTMAFSGTPAPMVRFTPEDGFDDTDEWYTPLPILALAHELLGDIDLDPASCEMAQRTVQAREYHTRASNGLKQRWRGRVWLNPPYSYPLVEQFADKLIADYTSGHVTQALVLVNNRADAAWCQRLMLAATATCFSAERIGFAHPRLGKPDQNRQGQIFFYFGDQPLRFAQIFGHFGAMFGQAVDGTQLRQQETEEAKS